ncbi:MAG: hypothetical protein HKN24_04265 [Acidimicrobiales bacterium]|nr:hypothetical protein [Acidimicrobiales bacterium]
MEPVYEVVWPKSARGVQSVSLASRLDDLDGVRIAFLWDYVFRGDEIFPALADHLRQRFPAIEIIDYDVFGNIHGGDEKEMISALPEALRSRHIDAVVSGVGC